MLKDDFNQAEAEALGEYGIYIMPQDDEYTAFQDAYEATTSPEMWALDYAEYLATLEDD